MSVTKTQKFNPKKKFKHSKKKFPFAGKRKGARKARNVRPIMTNLDRFYVKSYSGLLRPIQFNARNNKNTSLVRRQLRYVGTTGARSVRQAAATLRKFLIRRRACRPLKLELSVGSHRPILRVVCRKYRLKSVAFTRALPAGFSYAALSHRTFRQVQLGLHARKGNQLGSRRRRFATLVRLRNLRQAFASRRFTARRLRARHPKRRYSPRGNWLKYKAEDIKKRLRKLGGVQKKKAHLLHSRLARAHRSNVDSVYRQLS